MAPLFLFFFAPISAEYLIGYDDIIGEPLTLLFGLLIFGPLYGAPALLIRETVRRTGRGWVAILALGAAFGVIEAGLIDQSLFNPDYRDISYWQDFREPTLIAGTGVSFAMVFGFIGGHMLGSIGAPIALAEGLCPEKADQPWLGTRGLVLVAVLWLAAAGLVLGDTLNTESFRPSVGQLLGATAAAAALIAFALWWRRPPPRDAPGAAPPPLAVFAVALVCLGFTPLLGGVIADTRDASGWLPTLASLAVLIVLGVLVARWSGRPNWSRLHVLAAAAGQLLAVGLASFTVNPIGELSATDPSKLATNAFLFVGVLLLLRQAFAASARAGRGSGHRVAGQ